jgi:hypothetical protein
MKKEAAEKPDRCHLCRRKMSEVSGGVGNVDASGKLWCGCVASGASVESTPTGTE